MDRYMYSWNVRKKNYYNKVILLFIKLLRLFSYSISQGYHEGYMSKTKIISQKTSLLKQTTNLLEDFPQQAQVSLERGLDPSPHKMCILLCLC